MAEAIILGVMASLVQEGVLKLIKRFKDVKGTDAETRELKDFVDYLTKNEDLYTSSSKEVRTMLRESLDEPKRKLKEWSGKKSGFLERSSSERVQELQALRRKVESAISRAQFKFMDVIHAEQIRARNLARQQKKEILEAVSRSQKLPLESTRNGHQGTTSAQEAPHGRGETIKKRTSESTTTFDEVSSIGPPTRSKKTQPPSDGKGQHNSTRQQPSTRPPKSEDTAESPLRTGKLTKSDSKVQEQTSSKKRKVDLWQQLWVPIDSKKQANDLKERLRGLEGVKEVHIDQPSQKVSVLLREGSNVSKLTKALIESAQLKDKRKPTPWADRPR